LPAPSANGALFFPLSITAHLDQALAFQTLAGLQICNEPFGWDAPSSLLKNLEIESFRILAGRCWGGAVELDVIF
jgi:hypothetical protein